MLRQRLTDRLLAWARLDWGTGGGLGSGIVGAGILGGDIFFEFADQQFELLPSRLPPTQPRSHAKTLHIEKLKMQLAVLRRARFGRSSEKLDRDIEQLELLIGELEEEAAEEE